MTANSSGSGKNIRNAQWAFLFLIVGFVVLLLFFALSQSFASGQRAQLADMRSQGLQFASTQAQARGFEEIEVHDALGRDRRVGDGKDWVICTQSPEAGRMPRGEGVELGVVKVTETCPAADQGDPPSVAAGRPMPNFTGRTAWWVREALGPDAGIRFIDISDEEHEVTGNLGDWTVCVQSATPGSSFNGEPLLTIVTPYGKPCTPTTTRSPTPERMLTNLLNRLTSGDLADD